MNIGTLPPVSYEFEPSNEIRATILRVAEAHGNTLVVIPELEDGTRRFEKATGTAVSYFKGGDPELSGFTPPGHPEIGFINAQRSDIPLG